MSDKVAVWALAAVVLVFSSVPAFAYLEPGTGSLIVQSIIGGIAGVTVAASLYWNKLKAFFAARRGTGSEAAKAPETADAMPRAAGDPGDPEARA